MPTIPYKSINIDFIIKGFLTKEFERKTFRKSFSLIILSLYFPFKHLHRQNAAETEFFVTFCFSLNLINETKRKAVINVADIERLYSEYYGFIYKFLLSRSGNANLAEELAQETFFRAFMNIKKLKDDKKAVYWLCSIAKNLLYGWYNDQKRFVPIEDAAELQSKQSVEDTVENIILSERAMEILKVLDEPYKEVFMLSVFGNLSLKDISNAFNKSESWARVTLYRAKEKIIQEMKL